MSHASSKDITDLTPSPPFGPHPVTRWSLAETRPARLGLRLVGAALAGGVAGGIASAGLLVLFGGWEVSPFARFLAVGMPLVLMALVSWRLAASAGLVGATPSGKWITAAAAAGVALIAVAQGWSAIGEFNDDIAHNSVVALGVALYGAFFGLMPAVAAIVITVPTLLLLRTLQVQITLSWAQVLLTVFATVVTAVFALWLTNEMHAQIVTGIAAALAGTGAALTARWCLVDRQE